ncbi:patatin-like phospholipase family protein [Paracidovorax cattleyae]|uniref:Patatin-like phospholipase n=1 Tax=Paracidovorax cattleyae TaxID=80868 RepID=A0A1H0RPZ1_9BURK|nr:patatin-like phospholipase family protein [Paracidovorax cattleyae]AVS73998.1 patatin-like phospholipase family protein [Paracidovorax cattleyae]SDP31544.1 Patatin-like phospholipase [Paracidovorax cattleyae]
MTVPRSASGRALRIHAGPAALRHIEREGLSPADVAVVPAAAGGPKGLVLGPMDRFLFGDWLAHGTQPVHLVGASIGAWRMATACLGRPVEAFERLEQAYIQQAYDLPQGRKRPDPAHVSERFGQNLQAFYGGRVDEVLSHPRYRLHIVTSRGRHLLARENRVATPVGYLGAFAANAVHRRALGLWLERVVFSPPLGESAPAPLPFEVRDYPTRQVALDGGNFLPALQASCSIPFVLQAVHDIPGAPRGAYWDGGITDYHLHLHYGGHGPRRGGQGGLVLYPHFRQQVVPGWLDKGLRWRHRATRALDAMVLLSPDPAWVRETLPDGKLPDRQDFLRYGTDTAARARAWGAAVAASRQLANEFAQWLDRGCPADAVEPL